MISWGYGKMVGFLSILFGDSWNQTMGMGI
jgi:hypothetical protein